MGCIAEILALFTPRLVMVSIWILTDWFDEAYETRLWPVLGFLFMPYTTLAYMAGVLMHGSIAGWWLMLLIVAILVDAGTWSRSARSTRSRGTKAA